MDHKLFFPSSRATILHHYSPHLIAVEHPATINGNLKNTLLFVGGLGDGIHTIPYVSTLIDAVTGAGWSLVEVLLSSSYKGWGICSIARDAEEISVCVKYFRTIRGGKLVLMGHSTGCQDALEYLIKHSAIINGVIFQASVSDRESATIYQSSDRVSASLTHARSLIDSGRGTEIIPSHFRSPEFAETPVCAQRWWDLNAFAGADDYFSSDLNEEMLTRTFGMIMRNTNVLFLYSEKDQFVPSWVDKEYLLKRWYLACALGGAVVDKIESGVIREANHKLEGADAGVLADMIGRVIRFLGKV
ncbi:DUF1749-domain-containing protein [Choiromyces venosus 120613-1]|uniref:DUF1749-domain-containing protein n=1 Tax=Choiromyces venosus 120613-1 TaxID=1336337 RepID=A0A3N4J3T6_9PEZI|nr:DUF1749-domain-containing protein [Choiromyces venosus 120613-1]